MTVLASVDTHMGILRRYESGGEFVRLTHIYRHGRPATFMADFVEYFRETPDPEWAVSSPTNDPPPSPAQALRLAIRPGML